MIADLHIHGKYSRACSTELTIPNLEKWARVKGLELLGTGDFTHPKWIEHIKENLTEEDGLLKTKTGFNFVLQTEISLIYTQNGKGRSVHVLILAPSLEVVEQITKYLLTKGRVDYDGRPIFKIPCYQLVEDLRNISTDIEVIPAHCLLPGTQIHTKMNTKKIEEITEKDLVLTHKGRLRKVTKTYTRHYNGKIYKIVPWYFTLGLTTTPEHPFYAIKSVKNCKSIKGTCKPICSSKDTCKRKSYNNYSPQWIQAQELEKGDFLVYPRITKIIDKKKFSLDKHIKIPKKYSRTKLAKKEIDVNEDFCRLAGYFLAEGYTVINGAVAFSFNKNEKEYIQDVITLMKQVFDINLTKIDQRTGSDLIFCSKTLNILFKKLFYCQKEKRAWTKSVPNFMLYLPLKKQKELLRGWWRGDKGYTVSHNLITQMKTICLRLGIIPSISKETAESFNNRGNHFIKNRRICTTRDIFIFSNLSFFEDKELLKDESFKRFINKRNMKHGWLDKNYVYLPIKKIETKSHHGNVYNLEVTEDNSYVSEFAVVHNCWTPHFGLFGANGGFNSVEEAFKDQAKHVHALETGISSDPEMNSRLSNLDKYLMVSFSDAHSFWPWRLGREATIFDIKPTYKGLLNAIRTKEGFVETIECNPAYGKYHIDGHRNCNVSLEPKESLKLNNICPKCNKQLTIGVLHRVEELADRKAENAQKFKTLIPLSDLISALRKKGIATKAVWNEYNPLIEKFGNEYNVLLNAPEEDLKKANPELAPWIILNRAGKIQVKPGYDGVYGEPILKEKPQKSLAEFGKA